MQAKILFSIDDPVSAVDDRIYSSFIEHMGRAIYTGIYEPEHPTADAFGFRTDVMEAIRPLNLSLIRYPGGNFLSGYNWLDGIGPKENRPMRMDLAWFALEPNEVGTDEFLQWCERLGVQAMMGVNLGTGSPQSAADLLEYVNGDLPTKYANLRRSNGHEQPYKVKTWCLGNEMDGPWQICMKTAEEYGRIACETAKMMKWVDPEIELVACGSSSIDMPTFGIWEKTLLKHCYPYIDYISLHTYYDNKENNVPVYLARSLQMERMIRRVTDICEEARLEQNGTKEIKLSFDEWNVWYQDKPDQQPPKWTVARAIEEQDYNHLDALVVGCMLNTLLRNADSVKIACLAQLVNVIAPIVTEPGGDVKINAVYWPFFYASRYGRGTSLKISSDSPVYACEIMDQVPYLDCSAVLTDDSGISLFVINRHQEESITPEFPVHFVLDRHWVMEGVTEPVESGTTTMPPLSWNLFRLKPIN